MRPLRRLLRRLRNSATRWRDDERLREEIEEHLTLQTAENIRAGLPPLEARRQAVLKFGAAETIKEDYQAVQISWLHRLAILTLGLGVGASTAIFTLIDHIILKPLSYPHPEQLVSVEVSPLALDPTLRGMAPEDYFVFRDQSRTFRDIGIYAETDTGRDVNVTGFAEPERVHALNVTHGILSALEYRPCSAVSSLRLTTLLGRRLPRS